MITHTITAENIDNESYYNLVMLSEITHYADPLSAIKELAKRGDRIKWAVIKDECGNIINTNI